jgi:YidC/Oxa1 family membrane protein insertase
MLIILKFFFQITKSWGYAIILLTIAVKIVTWVPTQSSYKSMKKMQEVQPYLTALKEKYKDNPQKFNEEMMKVYKEKKVNPISGCLPLLLQMPIFIALYAVLANGIELKNASFLIWSDLSVKDPYFILIALMIVTMFIQQKMTPSADPQQAKMMMFLMPIMFAIFFFSLPAGVLLYWVIQNILSIVQQLLVNKSPKPA